MPNNPVLHPANDKGERNFYQAARVSLNENRSIVFWGSFFGDVGMPRKFSVAPKTLKSKPYFVSLHRPCGLLPCLPNKL
jgi:hypothetical protein